MGARFSAPFQTGAGAYPASCTMGTGSFPGVKSGRDVTLTSHPLLVPWSRKITAIPLLLVWTYCLYRASVPVEGCTLPYLPVPISQRYVVAPPRRNSTAVSQTNTKQSVFTFLSSIIIIVGG